MDGMHRLEELRENGRMRWLHDERGWIARPEEVVDALARQGYEEYKHEVAHNRRDRGASGGVWQGLNTQNGSVASAIWVRRARADEALVFIDIDGEPLRGQ